jgi:hypothetical protein
VDEYNREGTHSSLGLANQGAFVAELDKQWLASLRPNWLQHAAIASATFASAHIGILFGALWGALIIKVFQKS